MKRDGLAWSEKSIRQCKLYQPQHKDNHSTTNINPQLDLEVDMLPSYTAIFYSKTLCSKILFKLLSKGKIKFALFYG